MKFVTVIFVFVCVFSGGFLISPHIRFTQEIAVRKLFEKGVESVTHDKKHKIVLSRETRVAPELSITEVRLVDNSGSKKNVLGSNDKGRIECEIENKGGTAENVRVGWTLESPKKLPPQLKISSPETVIQVIKNSSKSYEISVETTDMKDSAAIEIDLSVFENEKLAFTKKFTLYVRPELGK